MAAQAGQNLTLTLNFYSQPSGTLADPSAITLDITYGDVVGAVPDVAGPVTYTGASGPSLGQVYRVSTGVYAYQWTISQTAQSGVYVANWSVTYGGNVYLVTEDVAVTGGFAPAQGVTETGYWTGSLAYPAPYGTQAIQFGAVDGNGTAWIIRGLKGFDSAPAVGQMPQRSGDHGGWPTPQFYGPRPMTLTVLASAPTQTLRDVARAQLQQVVPVSDLATFVYNEPVPKQLLVRRTGGASITETYATLTDAEFAIPLIAPDPRKYSTQQKTTAVNATPTSGVGLTIPATVPFTLPSQAPAGSVAVTNAGSFETRPTITITGPITGPSITNVTTGQKISYSQVTLGASDVLTVDLNARQGFFNGAFRSADIASSWWVLWPGVNVVQLGGSTSGGAAMKVTWSDAYM